MTRARIRWFACILIFGVLLRAHSQSANPKATQDWAAYGCDQAKTHYSPLTQINKSNVKQVEVAWSFDTKETGGLQSSPIEVAGVLYGISPTQKIFALHAATGKLKWKFDSGIVGTQPDRGLSYWASPDNKDRRIIVGVMNFVYALAADTGRPIPSFGDHGRVDLREGLGRDVATGFIALTSPAVIYKDLFIVGGRLPETLPALPGDIRAYDARTGKQRWSFHTIPHPGEFGYDTWPKEAWQKSGGANNWPGMTVDRATGKPLFPVESHKYPPSDLPGEVAAAEQPLPTKPAPYARQRLTEDMLTNRTPEAHQWALEQFRTFRSEGQFVPLSTKQNLIIFPGFDGGAEWGGPAFDPESGILYVNSNEMAWAVELAQNKADPQSGKGIYQSQCTICHRDDMKGSPPLFPSLLGVHDRMTQDQIKERIQKGKGRMPGFPNLTPDEVNALVLFVSEGENKEISGQPVQPQMGYRFSGYTRFLESERYPAIAPPWGTLNAINLNTGEYAWKIPFGEYPELAGQGIKNTGSENYGGPIVTAGGLLFIGATNYDKKFRVFDKSTGELLWETTLPFSGNATPITYQVNGKQYVVIAAGGGKDVKSPSGGVYVAFALKGSE